MGDFYENGTAVYNEVDCSAERKKNEINSNVERQHKSKKVKNLTELIEENLGVSASCRKKLRKSNDQSSRSKKSSNISSADNTSQVAKLLSQLVVTLQDNPIKYDERKLCEKEIQTELQKEEEVIESEKLEVLFQENLHLSNIVKVLEDDVAKYRYENHKLENALKKAQENLALNGKNQNNTSSCFALPSEFKTSWDDLIKDKLPSTFTDFLENPIIYLNIIQDLVLIINEKTKASISERNKEVCRILNISEKQEQQIYKQMINIYQDFNSSVFKIDEPTIGQIKDEAQRAFKAIINHKYLSELMTTTDVGNETLLSAEKFQVSSDFELYIEQLLESDDFLKFIQTFYSLCLFMNLNDPPLKLPIEPFAQRRYSYRYFHKNDLYCIDGFAKENAPSLVILPPVMRNNFPYKGIKPAVLIINNDSITDMIKEKMEEQEQDEKSKIEKKFEKDSHFQEDEITIGHDKDPFNCTSNNTSCILNESVLKKTLFQTARKPVATCDKEVSARENDMPMTCVHEKAIQTEKEASNNYDIEWFSSFCPLNGQVEKNQILSERNHSQELLGNDTDSDSSGVHSYHEEIELAKQHHGNSSLSFQKDQTKTPKMEMMIGTDRLERNINSNRGGVSVNRRQEEISEILAMNDDYSLDFGRKSDLYGLNKDNSVSNYKDKKLKIRNDLKESEMVDESDESCGKHHDIRTKISSASRAKSAKVAEIVKKFEDLQGFSVKHEAFQLDKSCITLNSSNNAHTVNNTPSNSRTAIINEQVGFFNEKRRSHQIPKKNKNEGNCEREPGNKIETKGRDLTLSDLCDRNVVSPSFKMICEGLGQSPKGLISNFNCQSSEGDQSQITNPRAVQNPLKLKIKEEMKKKLIESHKQHKERVTDRNLNEEKRVGGLGENLESKFLGSIKLAPNQEVGCEKLYDVIAKNKEYNSTIQSLKNSIEMLKNSRIHHNSDRNNKRKTENSGSPNNTIGCIKNQSNKLRNVLNCNSTYEETDSLSNPNHSLYLKKNLRGDSSAHNNQESNQVKDFVAMLSRDKKKSADKRLYIDEPREKEKSSGLKYSNQQSGSFLHDRISKGSAIALGKNKENNEKVGEVLGQSCINTTSKGAVKSDVGVKGILIESMLNTSDKARGRNLPSFIINNKDKSNESQKFIKNEINRLKTESIKKRSVSVNRKSKKENYLDFSSSEDCEGNSEGLNYQSEGRFLFENRKGSTVKKSPFDNLVEKKNIGLSQKENPPIGTMNRASELKRNFELIYREYKFNKKIAGGGENLAYPQNN